MIAPVLTPFTPELAPDAQRLVRLCRWLIARDTGLAVFGTTSEASSLTVVEKITLLDTLVAAGMPPERLLPGTGCCALGDTVELTRHAVRHGCGGVLMLPPYYFKGVSDEGLYASYSEVIQRVGDARLRIYLYHIPQTSQVPLSLGLIERLLNAYPGTVVGIKDSSGDWNSVRGYIEAFAANGFAVYPGSEALLLPALRAGGAGCISAQANINPDAIVRLYRRFRQPDADAQQADLLALRAVLLKFPMMAALKAVVAHYAQDDTWLTLRPPLVRLDPERRAELFAAMPAGFSMSDL